VPSTTGAPPTRGVWEQADGGTLLLNGISELSLEHQRKVLRAVKEHRIRRVGARQDTVVDVRVIAATTRDIHALAEMGHFNIALYDALRRNMIRVPPLRDHKDDLPFYAQFYWRFYTKDPSARLGRELIDDLRTYSWQGNMRELKDVLANVHTLFDTKDPNLDQLRSLILSRSTAYGSGELRVPDADSHIHWIRSVQHLRRVDGIVASCQFAMKDIMLGHEDVSPERAFDLDDLGRLLDEMDDLLKQPTLFSGEQAYKLVHELQGTMRYQYGYMQSDVPKAETYWVDKMQIAFDPVRVGVAEAIQHVVSGTGDD